MPLPGMTGRKAVTTWPAAHRLSRHQILWSPGGKTIKMEPIDNTTREPVPEVVKPDTWKRGLIMLVFILAFGVAQSLLYLTAVVQFLWLLLTKERNGLLVGFGKSLALWLAETARYLCCATDEKPFPWSAWPKAT